MGRFWGAKSGPKTRQIWDLKRDKMGTRFRSDLGSILIVNVYTMTLVQTIKGSFQKVLKHYLKCDEHLELSLIDESGRL